MAVEIERTFLAKYLPRDLLKYPYKDCLDIYVPSSSRHPHLRIRQLGEVYEITKKQPITSASHQQETTIPLSKEEFIELATVKGKRVQKRRYYYRVDDHMAEIDIFGGDLSGLVLVDFEFISLDKASQFVPPEFCLINITQEEFIAGGYLTGKNFSDVQSRLNKFHYQQIL